MPNDSPSIAGEHATVAPRRRRRLLVVGDAAEPLDLRRVAARAARRSAGPSPATQSSASRSRPRERVEQHPEALARLVPADEEDRRPRRSAAGRAFAKRSTSTPFGHDLALRRRTLTRPGAPPRSDTAVRDVSGGATAGSGEPAASGTTGCAPARAAVERADRRDRRCRAARRGWRRARAARAGARRRARTCGAPRACGAPTVLAGGDRRDRAVARDAGARPDGGDAGLGRRAVARGR